MWTLNIKNWNPLFANFTEYNHVLPKRSVVVIFFYYNLFPGFVKVLQDRKRNPRISKISLLDLKESAALGAASLGARSIKHNLPINYSQNAAVYFQAEF